MDYNSFLLKNIINYEIKQLNYYQIRLYKIYYKGINSKKVLNRNIITDFEKNMKIYKIIYIFKIIIFCLIAIAYLLFIISIFDFSEKKKFIIMSIILLSLMLINIIISIINLMINYKYIYNFMDLIDIYFEKKKLVLVNT